MKNKDYVVVVQCQIVKEKCSGYFCEYAFSKRTGAFSGYPADGQIRFLSLTCGGCCGRAVHRKLAHLIKRIAKKENIEKDIKAVYRLFPALEERTKQYAGTLSGGEQQMLAIGRALKSRPKLLLLDCPTLGLAPKLAKKVVKALSELKDEGITILLIDQKLQQVIDVADRGYVVEGGGIIRQDSPQELLISEENNRFVSPKA